MNLKIILFVSIFCINLVADRIGLDSEPRWVVVSQDSQMALENGEDFAQIAHQEVKSLKDNESPTSLDDIPLAKTISIDSNSTQTTTSTIKSSKIAKNSIDLLGAIKENKTIKVLLKYLSPLWNFAKNNSSLFVLFVTFLWILFYLFFYRPLSKKLKEYDELEISYSDRITKSLAN